MVKYFKSGAERLPLPIFFPDATRGIVKTLDSKDLENLNLPGLLVNTYHLYLNPGEKTIKKFDGVRNFMNWKNAIISDSGGFQVMSIVKKYPKMGRITDKGVLFKTAEGISTLFTPELSIKFQMALDTDLLVVLDEFTHPNASHQEAKESVDRTIAWALRSKNEFKKNYAEKRLSKVERPYLIAVVQGGKYLDLRIECTKKLSEIGFDGLGYGGSTLTELGKFDYEVAKVIAENSPKDYLLYGLGVGKPDDIVGCYKLGFQIFDCVLPTRDARHKRLYIYNSSSIDKIDVNSENFYSYYHPGKEKYKNDPKPISNACDCLLCQRYSRAYLYHLFKIKDISAFRLASIHNLRFYTILMEKLRKETSKFSR
ncbi:MAG: tRNA guanosine(34) transglycosylase Tgt [Patescibacteria group bacterium]